MPAEPVTNPRSSRLPEPWPATWLVEGLACAAGAVVIVAGLGALAGLPDLSGLGRGFVPIPLLVVVLVLLLDAAILLRRRRRNRVLRALGTTAGVLGTVLALGIVAGFVLGGPVAASLSAQHVSKVTAVTLLIAGLAWGMTGADPAPHRWKRQLAAALALAPSGIGAVVALSYVAGAPLLYQSGHTPMSLPSALAALATGLALLGLAGRDTWPLSLFAASPGARQAPSIRGPMAAFLLMALAMLVGGSFYLRAQLRSARLMAQDELSSIADLKASQIAAWHRERMADARQIEESRLLQENLLRFLAYPGPDPEVEEWLTILLKGGEYDRVVLFDAKGHSRFPASGAETPAAFREALTAGRVTLGDLDRDASGIHLDLWVPVGRAEGVLLLRMDPRPFLFPLVQSWPTSSATAETLLVRREGADVVFLNELRHRSGTALNLRIPTTGNASLLPVVLAATGGKGAGRGLDYRGVPVLACLRRVPGTPWSMVAKMDEDEIYGPLRVRAWISGVTLLGLVTLLALGIGLQLKQLEAARVAEQLARERQGRIQDGRFHNLLRMANDAILTFDTGGRILDANDRALEYYGWTLDEMRRLRVPDLRSVWDAPTAQTQFEELALTGMARFEAVHKRKDGSTFPVEVSSRLVDIEGEHFAFSLIHDISDRRARERELEKLTQLYAALSQVNQAIVWTRSREELFAKICEVMVEFGRFRMAWIAGCEGGEIRVFGQYGDEAGYLPAFGTNWKLSDDHTGPVGTALLQGRACIANDYQSTVAGPWREAARRSGLAAVAAFPIRLRGEVFGALAVYDAYEGCFGEKEIQLLEEAATDMSFALDHLAGEVGRERAEAALHESEQRFRTLFEKSPVGYLTLDARGRILDVNEAMAAMAGRSREELAGLFFEELLAPDSAEQAREASVRLRATGRVGSTELTLARPDATTLVANFEASNGLDEAGRFQHTHCVLSDLTGRLEAEAAQRDLQAQLYQSQKMESLGGLAGGIAHDINNVLAAILSLASAHREGLAGTELLAQSLDTISTACLRGRDVVKSLLYFARKGVTTLGPVDLNEVVRDMMKLLARTTLKRIRLETELEEPLPPVEADAGTLSHALMNLCVNAKDAMPLGGTIRIRTRRLEDGRLEIGVRDTGEGMTEEVRTRAMEPFFTTKPTGQGTGLGLAMVFGTLKSLGGSTEIVSAPGRGTEVLLRFPAPVEDRTQAPLESPAEGAPPKRCLSVLLVDDDELIRGSVVPMLRILGHEAQAVDSGLKALNLFQGGLEVDLVILDMNMPGINGAETLHGILLLRPGQKVIMASGYNDHDVAGLLEGRPGVVSIQKPFLLKEVRRSLQALGLD